MTIQGPLLGKSAHSDTEQMPEVNVLPMLNVLMGVLGFFVVVTLSLNGTQPAGIALPQGGGSAIAGNPTPGAAAALSLMIGLNRAGQLSIDGRPISRAALVTEVKTYLAQNPQGQVILQADRGLTFGQLSPTLEVLQAMGSDRIGLAMQP
jgi:biopolymer transport protein ExbD